MAELEAAAARYADEVLGSLFVGIEVDEEPHEAHEERHLFFAVPRDSDGQRGELVLVVCRRNGANFAHDIAEEHVRAMIELLRSRP